MTIEKQSGESSSGGASRIVRDYINERLYPAEDFPRHIFLDLDQILTDHFLAVVQTAPQVSLMEGQNRETIKSLAGEQLKIEVLLRDHPQVLIRIYTPLIQRFLKQKTADKDQQQDIYQEIAVRLLHKKLSSIYRHYRFDFSKKRLFSSYFMVTVRNIYIDIIREKGIKLNKEVSFEDAWESGQVYESPPIGRLIVEEELIKLNALLKMFYQSTAKIELCLKLKYRIRLDQQEIRRSFPNCSPEEIEILTANYQRWRDRTIFKTIVPIFNRWEGKQNKGDTLRKWLDLKIDEIISQLNKTHGHRVYNTKNFSELLILYYQRFQHFKKNH